MGKESSPPMTCTPPRTTTPAHRNAKSAAKTRRCGAAAAADGDRWPLAAGEPPPPPPLPAATVTLQLPSLLSFLSFADIAIAGAGHNRRSRSGSSPDPQAAAASLTGHTIRNALQGVVEHRRPANISMVGCRGRGRGEAKRRPANPKRWLRSQGGSACRPTPAAAVSAGQPARLYPRPGL